MHIRFQPDALPPFILPEMPLHPTPSSLWPAWAAIPVAQEQNPWDDPTRNRIVAFSARAPCSLSVTHTIGLSASIASAKFRHTILDAACPAPSASSEVTFAQPLMLQNDCPLPCCESRGAQLSSSSVSPVSEPRRRGSACTSR
ncbi:hypothetical protein MYU51_000031 [Penicillium brevicompactum]